MLHVHTAPDPRTLASGLAAVLGVPLDDPFEPEWIAVPSSGMRRWLALELARTLGAAPGAHDGVAANIEWAFPGSLRRAVLDAGADAGATEPWEISRLVWFVLAAFETAAADDRLAALLDPSHRAPRYTRARNVADLFDRYHVHRPSMVLRWASGDDVDARGRDLAPDDCWQPHLWRLVRAAISTPSPPERLPGVLDAVRRGTIELDLPSRLAVFGTTVAPGGASFYELADAIGTQRDVHLFQLEASPGLAGRARALVHASGTGLDALRNDVPFPADGFPLLAAWGRQLFEGAALGAAAVSAGVAPEPQPVATPDGEADTSRTTLLGRLQAAVLTDTVAAPEPFDPADTSVRVHACSGATRQVEVVRDALLHLLADDPTLCEDDIVVLCPSLDAFAPIVESVFGPSADSGLPDHGAPALRYRVADRSLRAANPVLAAMSTLLSLATSRFEATTVLDFCSLPVVRARIGFSDADLERMRAWVSDLGVRWGLDPVHRERFGVPSAVRTNTWQQALDRLLLGSAVATDERTLVFDAVPAVAAESDDAALAGRLADCFARLRPLVDAAEASKPLAEWIELLDTVAQRTLASAPGEEWQFDALASIFADLLDAAAPAEAMGSAPELTMTDLQRLVEERLADAPGRPDFFRGGITVTSLRPLRGLPYRVVVLLDLSDAGLGGATSTGDDLVARDAQLADRDARADARQSLLEAVLAAQERLVIVRDARDVRTNAEIPESVVLTEFLDAVLSLVDPAERAAARASVCIEHPRHGFDTRCFTMGSITPDRPWSFDPFALDAARAASSPAQPFVLCPDPLPDDGATSVSLDALHAFLRSPIRTFLVDRLELHLPSPDDSIADDLPVEVDKRARSVAGNRLLADLVAGRGSHDWVRAEAMRGSIVVDSNARAVLADLVVEAGTVADAVQRIGATGDATSTEVEAVLADGTVVAGTVATVLHGRGSGPVRARFVRPRTTDRLAAWLDLLVLTVTRPEVDWCSIIVARSADPSSAQRKGAAQPPTVVAATVRGADVAERRAIALDALEHLVAWYRRARTEPLPIAIETSLAIADGVKAGSAWQPFNGSGERGDAAVQAAFGDMELGEFLAIPARGDDPPGDGTSRVERWAKHIWSVVRSSVEFADEAVAP